jgi:hypothetical protein
MNDRSVWVRRAFSFVVATCCIIGCKSGPSPQRLSEEAKSLGVYALNGSQLTEIDMFGRERSFAGDVTFDFPEPIIKAPSDTSFVVNLPNSNISEAKVYLLANPEKAIWSHDRPERDPKPIKASIEPQGSGIYKVTPSQPLSGDHPRYLCLFLSMPLGTADRLYAVDTGGWPRSQ